MNTQTCSLWSIVILSFVSFKWVTSTTCKSNVDTSASSLEILDQLTDPCRYNKWRRPNATEKTIVYTHIHVFSMVNIDPQHLEYTVQILLRYRWRDPRLVQANILRHEGELSSKIWHPHLYITNEQYSTVMGSPQKDIMHSIWPDGTIVSLSRKKITLRCDMDLQKFPFDSQHCPLIMESWSYNTNQLELMWEEDAPITVDSQLNLPEYLLVGIITNSSTASYNQGNKGSSGEHMYGKSAGNFSTLTLHFALKRLYGFYIMDYYVPSTLIVVVSWVSFWLDANSTPGRTILGTSTLLTFITLSRNIGSSLPKVSYVKSSEVWYLGCIGFLFSSLAEFAFVNVIWRRKKNVNLKKVTSKHILQSTLTPQTYRKEFGLNSSKSLPSMCPVPENTVISEPRINGRFSVQRMSQEFSSSIYMQDGLSTLTLPVPKQNDKDNSKTLFMMTPQEISNWIDRKSRLMFPIAFLIFNCIYWSWTILML